MRYEVTVADGAARPTAVVAATTTWPEFPTLWVPLLDEVWACLRAGGIERGCRNIMLYLDDVPHVEVGVELIRPWTAGAVAHAGRGEEPEELARLLVAAHRFGDRFVISGRVLWRHHRVGWWGGSINGRQLARPAGGAGFSAHQWPRDGGGARCRGGKF